MQNPGSRLSGQFNNLFGEVIRPCRAGDLIRNGEDRFPGAGVLDCLVHEVGAMPPVEPRRANDEMWRMCGGRIKGHTLAFELTVSVSAQRVDCIILGVRTALCALPLS